MFFSLFPSQPADKPQFCLPTMKQAPPASSNLPNSWSGASPPRRSNAGGRITAAPSPAGNRKESQFEELLSLGNVYSKIFPVCKNPANPKCDVHWKCLRIKGSKSNELLCDASPGYSSCGEHTQTTPRCSVSRFRKEERQEAGLCLCITSTGQAAHAKLIIGNVLSHCN